MKKSEMLNMIARSFERFADTSDELRQEAPFFMWGHKKQLKIRAEADREAAEFLRSIARSIRAEADT